MAESTPNTNRQQYDGLVPHWQLRQARRERDGVFHERNQVVAALAHLMAALVPGTHLVIPEPTTYPESRRRKRRDVVRPMVCIHLPGGRNLTWHFSPEEEIFFVGLPYAPSDWDGHTTDKKYERLADLPVEDIVCLFVKAVQ